MYSIQRLYIYIQQLCLQFIFVFNVFVQPEAKSLHTHKHKTNAYTGFVSVCAYEILPLLNSITIYLFAKFQMLIYSKGPKGSTQMCLSLLAAFCLTNKQHKRLDCFPYRDSEGVVCVRERPPSSSVKLRLNPPLSGFKLIH